MANICYFKMTVKASSKDNIKKFIKCFNYKKYTPELTVARTELKGVSRIKEYNGNYYCLINGECDWSICISMTDYSRTSFINLKSVIDRYKLRTINYFCKLHKVNVEIIGTTYEDGNREHIYVNELGKTLIYENYVVSEYDTSHDGQFIYQEVLDNGEDIKTKIKNNYLYYFLLNRYEQNKKKNIITLFSNKWNDHNYFYTNIIFADKVVTKEELGNQFDINYISSKDYVIALSKGNNIFMIEKILNNNISLLDNEDLFRELLKNSYCNCLNTFTILDIIPDNYQKKYENIIKEMYETEQNSNLDPFEGFEDEIAISDDFLSF